MMPVVVVLSVLLAAVVCLLAWLIAGRPTRARARHGMEPGRLSDDLPVDLSRTLDGGFDDLGLDPVGPAISRVIGPEDDPEFIRQLARAVAERGERGFGDGDLPPE
jgi:hypothetical protein